MKNKREEFELTLGVEELKTFLKRNNVDEERVLEIFKKYNIYLLELDIESLDINQELIYLTGYSITTKFEVTISAEENDIIIEIFRSEKDLKRIYIAKNSPKYKLYELKNNMEFTLEKESYKCEFTISRFIHINSFYFNFRGNYDENRIECLKQYISNLKFVNFAVIYTVISSILGYEEKGINEINYLEMQIGNVGVDESFRIVYHIEIQHGIVKKYLRDTLYKGKFRYEDGVFYSDETKNNPITNFGIKPRIVEVLAFLRSQKKLDDAQYYFIKDDWRKNWFR